MNNITETQTISSLLAFYKNERRIFGRCPHCHEAFRLSEVKLTYGQEPPRDLMTHLKTERDRLLAKVEELETTIEDLEEDHSSDIANLNEKHENTIENLNDRNQAKLEALDEKWNDKVSLEVERQLGKERKEIRRKAIASSRACQLGKTLEKVVPMFPGFGHHPYDVRPVFDPIDYVVFDGYYEGEVSDITFVEFKTGAGRISQIQNSIRDTVIRKRVHFETRRISRETLRIITNGRALKPKQLVE